MPRSVATANWTPQTRHAHACSSESFVPFFRGGAVAGSRFKAFLGGGAGDEALSCERCAAAARAAAETDSAVVGSERKVLLEWVEVDVLGVEEDDEVGEWCEADVDVAAEKVRMRVRPVGVGAEAWSGKVGDVGDGEWREGD